MSTNAIGSALSQGLVTTYSPQNAGPAQPVRAAISDASSEGLQGQVLFYDSRGNYAPIGGATQSPAPLSAVAPAITSTQLPTASGSPGLATQLPAASGAPGVAGQLPSATGTPGVVSPLPSATGSPGVALPQWITQAATQINTAQANGTQLIIKVGVFPVAGGLGGHIAIGVFTPNNPNPIFVFEGGPDNNGMVGNTTPKDYGSNWNDQNSQTIQVSDPNQVAANLVQEMANFYQNSATNTAPSYSFLGQNSNTFGVTGGTKAGLDLNALDAAILQIQARNGLLVTPASKSDETEFDHYFSYDVMTGGSIWPGGSSGTAPLLISKIDVNGTTTISSYSDGSTIYTNDSPNTVSQETKYGPITLQPGQSTGFTSSGLSFSFAQNAAGLEQWSNDPNYDLNTWKLKAIA